MTSIRRALAVWAIVPVLAVSLSGCASLARIAHSLIERPTALARVQPLKVKPVITADDDRVATLSPSDRLYNEAADAIRARRYADALDLLQYARQSAPQDVRVLNALGVVYDKLGRFDLSGRYYALALQADPHSTIVAANVAYSRSLQIRNEADQNLRQAEPLLAQRLLVAPDAVTAAPAPFVVATAEFTPTRVEPLFTGQAMLVLNATGRPLGQEPARRYLAQAGWSVRTGEAPVQARTEIRYAARFAPVAEALARTLPFPARLADCSQTCNGVQLVLGRDAPQTLKPRSRERS